MVYVFDVYVATHGARPRAKAKEARRERPWFK
jgi:hypothetical protein